ncbi:unnamed protein product, partial [Staurois parvus]
MTGPRRLRAIHKAHAQWAPGCHRSRHGKKKEGQLRGSGSGYLSNSVSGNLPLLSAVSGHPLYCLQSLVICTMSTVSGHSLYYVRSLWSSPVLCPQSLVIPCTVSAVSGHSLYCVCS